MKSFDEKIFSAGITIILGIVTSVMLIFLSLQLALGPLGTRPAPTWLLLLFTLFFSMITWNFFYLKTIMTDDYVQASYGLLKKKMLWKDIREIELDDKNYFYGYGVRFGRYKHRWVWIFNIFSGQRVAFLGEGKGLIISTKKLEEMIKAAKERIR